METLHLKEKITFKHRRTYPNCKTSLIIQELIGKNGRGQAKTFTDKQIDLLKQLGYNIEIEQVIPKGRYIPKD